MLSLQNFALALFSISLGAKGLLSTHSLASFVSICSVLIKSAFFFLNASNSSVSLIVHWWTEYCFSQRIVKSHAYPLVLFTTLCNWASRQTFLFECDQSMLWLPIVVACFSHIQFHEKIYSKTFLMLVWISSWFNCVYQARSLRTFHCLRYSEDQTQLTDLWSGMKVKNLFCLLENGRFVLSWTLTFFCALLSPEVTCENAWSLCYVGSINVELEGQMCNKGLRYNQQDKRELRMLGSNRPILLMLCS